MYKINFYNYLNNLYDWEFRFRNTILWNRILSDSNSSENSFVLGENYVNVKFYTVALSNFEWELTK